MTNETEDIYKTHLKNTIDMIAKKSIRLRPQYEKIDDVFCYYKKYKTIIQKNMREKDDVLTEDDFMDHHKIAAALCCSVLKAKPIKFIMEDSGKEPEFIEKYANEQCAYLLGLQAIQHFRTEKINESGKDERDKKQNIYVRTPKPYDEDNNTYIDWFAKLIRKETFEHLDYESNKFEETLMFYISHIFFLIESYTFQYYKIV